MKSLRQRALDSYIALIQLMDEMNTVSRLAGKKWKLAYDMRADWDDIWHFTPDEVSSGIAKH